MKFYLPTNILFGAEHISDFVNTFAGLRLAVITNEGKRRLNDPKIIEILDSFKSVGTEYFVLDYASPNPTYENVLRVVEGIKTYKCSAVIAVGGGSAIDCAKAAAYQVLNEKDFWHYIINNEECTNRALPIGVINTTAGTGSEINCCAVITKNNEKRALFCQAIYPRSVLILPELTCSIPVCNSIDQALDSMYHAIEGFFSRNASAFSEMFSINCVQIILSNIQALIECPTDVIVRRNLCLASIYSSMSDMYGGCLSAHSLGHAITAYHPEVSHGRSITLIASKYYSMMLKTDEQCIVDKKKRLTDLFSKQFHLFETDSADLGLILNKFFGLIGLGNLHMRDYGIEESDISCIYRNARDTVGELFENDPRVLSDEEFIQILKESL